MIPVSQWECRDFLFQYENWYRRFWAFLRRNKYAMESRQQEVLASIRYYEFHGWTFEPAEIYDMGYL